MSEAEFVALITAGLSVLGVLIGIAVRAIVEKKKAELTSSELLLKAQEQLADTIADTQRLWQWNRQLIDHIYRGAPPPPPQPPDHLFTD